MGNGLPPGPANDLGPPIRVDDGTSARTESPPPGPISLDAKSGGAKQSQASMADQIVAFPRHRMGERYGDGECFAVADRALRNAGARSAADFGSVVPDADYVWGTSINLSALRPGDIIQFRNYRYDREIDTSNPDGSGATATDFQERPHHTAIVERVDANGAVTVLEQNSPPGAPVARNQLFFTGGTFTSGNQTTRITVQGTFWFYRPLAR
ncbi:MAG: CHAP domain-containing protein [Vicinamibacterales bacterium]